MTKDKKTVLECVFILYNICSSSTRFKILHIYRKMLTKMILILSIFVTYVHKKDGSGLQDWASQCFNRTCFSTFKE